MKEPELTADQTPGARAAPDADAEAASMLPDDAAGGESADERDGKPDGADGADMLLEQGRGREQFGMSESSNDARMAGIAAVLDQTGKKWFLFRALKSTFHDEVMRTNLLDMYRKMDRAVE